MLYSLRAPTDTAHPQPAIPILLVHTVDRPFCPIPSCFCHQNQKEIAKLLEAIRDGEMTLHEAARFSDGMTV